MTALLHDLKRSTILAELVRAQKNAQRRGLAKPSRATTAALIERFGREAIREAIRV